MITRCGSSMTSSPSCLRPSVRSKLHHTRKHASWSPQSRSRSRRPCRLSCSPAGKINKALQSLTSHHFGSGLFSTRGANRCVHVLHFFRRRQHSLHSQRFDPEFTRPTLGVIEVLILFRLDLRVCILQHFRRFTFQLLAHLTNEMPVLMILRLGQHDSFSSDELSCSRLTVLQR